MKVVISGWRRVVRYKSFLTTVKSSATLISFRKAKGKKKTANTNKQPRNGSPSVFIQPYTIRLSLRFVLFAVFLLLFAFQTNPITSRSSEGQKANCKKKKQNHCRLDSTSHFTASSITPSVLDSLLFSVFFLLFAVCCSKVSIPSQVGL